MELKLNFDTPSYEWNVYRGKTFTVQVRCWRFPSEDKFTWNVYAYIYEKHPLFSQVEYAMDNLYFHAGATLEEMHTIAPALGIRYDWQRENRTLKLGSDYQHLHDNYFRECDPQYGIPYDIQRDAELLTEQLFNYNGVELIENKM